MGIATLILITGHPATGKTTVAHFLAQELQLPLIWKDQIKESLSDSLGWSTREWSRKLGVATWKLLYLQIENLLQANVSQIVEGNFDPAYASQQWQALAQKYHFQLIQIRCETTPAIIQKRYTQRITSGNRHPGHIDDHNTAAFLDSIQAQLGWIAVAGECIPFDTTEISPAHYAELAQTIRALLSA